MSTGEATLTDNIPRSLARANLFIYTSPGVNDETLIDKTLVTHDHAPGLGDIVSTGEGGGGFLMNVGRLIIDLSGSGVGGAARTGSYTADFGAGQGGLGIGFVAVRRPGFRLYPLVTIGGGGGGVSLSETTPSSAQRPDTTSNGHGGQPDASTIIIGGGGPRFSLGLGADVSLRLGPLALLVGAQIGYAIFNLDMEKDKDHRNVNANGPFLRLLLGAGFNRRGRRI